jgi:hypothetical protein
MVYIKLNSNYGSITHYFHFFFAVLIPIILYHLKNKEKNFIITDDLGPMLKILYDIPLNIIFKCEENIKSYIKLDALDSFKSKYYYNKNYKKMTFEDKIKICSFFESNFPSYFSLQKYDIILIERKIEEKYKLLDYSSSKNKMIKNLGKKSGSERRYIKNHKDIAIELKKIFGNKFKNISLENKPIMYQYFLFKHAKLIICQHGAALANIIFMQPNSCVLEIIPLSKLKNEGEDSFKNISEMCKINYYSLETNEDIPIINIDSLKIIIDKLLYISTIKK